MRNQNRLIQRGTEIDNPIITSSKVDSPEEYFDGKKNEGISFNSTLLLGIFSLVLVIIFGRVFYLQIVKGNYYQAVAENNRIRAVVIKAPRGIIKDKNGEVLARNIPSFDATFIPAELPKEYSQRKDIYQNLGQILNMNETTLETIMEPVDHNAKEGFLIKENIDTDTALVLEEKYSVLKGIYVEKTARREYPLSKVFSPIIGYDGKITKEELEKNSSYLMTDYIGKNGLEYTYEKQLHGEHGQHRIEVDSNGKAKEDLGIINPVPGDELVLNIDAGLQKKTYEVLDRIMTENPEAIGATAVAINPQDGGVLALVNAPSYDNNLFAGGISQLDYSALINDPKRPMTNRAVSGEYPPGSTFKPLVAAAALEEKLISEGTTVGCHGNISVGSWNFPDWKTHGTTDVKKAIAESCDVFFYAVGGGWDNISGLGMNRMARYAKLFGLGDLLGIDLPWEGKGNIPTEDWKLKKFGEKWYVGDNYHCSIGQGFITSTPLQIANYTAAVANGGKVYRPRIVDKIIHADSKQEEIVKPEILNQNFISANNIRIVQEGMRQTILDGSGTQLKDLPVSTAGKTGTAQFGADEKLHSWFISYGPYENPEIAMVILIEGGGQGHDWAVPATKEIYQWYFEQRGKN